MDHHSHLFACFGRFSTDYRGTNILVWCIFPWNIFAYLSWYLFISIDIGIPLSPSAVWGKPLDIYRQQKIVQSLEDGRWMLEEVPSITLDLLSH
jgi:hypothetical protein